jgi:Kef-type K+ transport system membrane component KefB
MEKKSQAKRAEAGFIFAIVLGLILGIAIKRVRLGILLGLLIGGAIVFLGWVRSRKNN